MAASSDHDIYNLENIEISKNSHQLPQESQVISGTLSVDKVKKLVTLTFERKYFCAPDSICSMEIRPPVIIVLPITHIGWGYCGGEIIGAEFDTRQTEGVYTSITIFNDNGNLCEINGSDKPHAKPVDVEFAELGPLDTCPTISTMEGIAKE